MIVLSDINDVIDKSIMKAIYNVAFDNGYTPDRTNPDRPTYEQALKDIATAKGFALEIFGAASNDARDHKKVPRIVYDNIGFVSGELGGHVQFEYKDNGSFFDKKKTQPRTGHLRFKVTLTSKTSAQDRVSHAILAASVPNRGVITLHNDPTIPFIVRYLYSVSNPDLKEQLIEKIYFYEAVDLYEAEEEVVSTTIAKIGEINVDTPEGDPITGPIT